MALLVSEKIFRVCATPFILTSSFVGILWGDSAGREDLSGLGFAGFDPGFDGLNRVNLGLEPGLDLIELAGEVGQVFCLVVDCGGSVVCLARNRAQPLYEATARVASAGALETAQVEDLGFQLQHRLDFKAAVVLLRAKDADDLAGSQEALIELFFLV